MKTLLPLLFAILPVTAMAGQASSSFQVTLRVVNSCQVSTDALRFPDYNPRSAGVTAQGAVNLLCTKGTAAKVYIDGEQTVTDSAGNEMVFSLTGPEGQPWTGTESVDAMGEGRHPIRLAMTGHVQGGQTAPDGDYARTLTTRVIF